MSGIGYIWISHFSKKGVPPSQGPNNFNAFSAQCAPKYNTFPHKSCYRLILCSILMSARLREEQSSNHVILVEGFPPFSPGLRSNKILFICIFGELSTNIFQNCSKWLQRWYLYCFANVVHFIICFKCRFTDTSGFTL